MRLGKALADQFPTIRSIKKLGKNIIAVNFKFSFDANQFAQSSDILPDNWVTYIPNYKINRTGIVKGVDSTLSSEEILQGIKLRDKPMEIKFEERLKFRDKENNNELKESTTVKIEFVSNLLPEYITIWSVRSRVKPYINRVRRCYNCLRWGHSAAFCRRAPICPRCGNKHNSDGCPSDSFICPDCKQSHVLFDYNCPFFLKSFFLKYNLINTVMAYCNVSQFIAKRQIKSKNVCNLEQAMRVFKSSTYLAWDNIDIISNFGASVISSTSSVKINKTKRLSKRRSKSNKFINVITSDSDHVGASDNFDATLILTISSNDNEPLSKKHYPFLGKKNINYSAISE